MIDYRIRESTRARSVHLEISGRTGLVVVVPRGFNHAHIPALLKEREAWIERTLQRLSQQARPCELEGRATLPDRVQLQSIGEEWTVHFQPEEGTWVRVAELAGPNLAVSGNTANEALCAAALQRWINWKARGHLVPWLRQVGSQEGLPFSGATVRAQRTRWGSCSQRKTISINQNLLFLPPQLVRYVFLHELCHTVQMNHSKKFWALVGKKEPEYKALRAQLRAASQWVPGWVVR